MSRRKPSSGRGGGGRGSSRPRRPQTNRQYPRTARLNTLLQEIAADFVDRVDDDDLPMVTVTGVEVDADLNKAQVFVSTFGTAGTEPTPETDENLLEILGRYAKPLRSAIGRQARLRKTPEVVFQIDPAVRAGARIEKILSGLDIEDEAPDWEEE